MKLKLSLPLQSCLMFFCFLTGIHYVGLHGLHILPGEITVELDLGFIFRKSGE